MMVIKGGEVVSESDDGSAWVDASDSISPLEDCSDACEHVEYAVYGESLIARRALNL